MIKTSLIAKSSEIPENLISHAAKTCYTSSVPEMGKLLDVENQLFRTGHHTTFQHNYFSFNIEGLSVSSATFGLHLCHPFYNTDQRSGRYSKMYGKPDYDEISSYISKFWEEENIEKIIEFIKKGRKIYKDNIEKATEIAKKWLKEERPFINDELLENTAPKIAQEQMRTFLSTIFSSALDITLNLSAIGAMYRSAWSPELREIFNQIKYLILQEYPTLSYVFENQREDNWEIELENNIGVLKEPKLHSANFDFNDDKNYNFDLKMKDSVDLRYFTPEMMENDLFLVKSVVEVSIATFGQDQRHRTIKRNTPRLTGNFYLPPILVELGLENQALEYMKEYIELFKNIDKSLALAIAPYGVMVKYTKCGDLNAVLHEQEKRLCWTAQEEIYNLSTQLHEEMKNHEKDKIKELSKHFAPSCYKGNCIEGKRYCGRDLRNLKNNNAMPKRKV